MKILANKTMLEIFHNSNGLVISLSEEGQYETIDIAIEASEAEAMVVKNAWNKFIDVLLNTAHI